MDNCHHLSMPLTCGQLYVRGGEILPNFGKSKKQKIYSERNFDKLFCANTFLRLTIFCYKSSTCSIASQ